MINWSYRNTVLALCMAAFFVTMGARVVISPVVPLITASFEISNTQIGFALTGIWLAYALTQFPSGVLADRYGEKPIILVSIGGTAVMSFLIAVTPFFGLFVVVAVLLGAVAGLHYSVGTTLLSRLFDDLGTPFGVHGAGAPLAGLFVPAAAAWTGTRYGWRPAVAIGAVIGVPVFFLFLLRVKSTEPRQPSQPMRDRFRFSFLFELLSRPAIAFTLVIAVLSTFVFQGILSFLPTFLVNHHGQSTPLAGLFFSAFWAVNGGAQVGVGSLSDRYGQDVVFTSCMVLGGGGLALLIIGPTLGWIGVGVVLLGIGMGFQPALLPRFLDEFSDGERGAGFGLVRTTYGVFGAAGSVGVGLFADLFDWGTSFLILAALCGLVALLVVANFLLDLEY